MLVWGVIILMLSYLAFWLIDFLGAPYPLNKVAKVVVILIALIALFNLISPLIGGPLLK
jgi:hypothetical protein